MQISTQGQQPVFLSLKPLATNPENLSDTAHRSIYAMTHSADPAWEAALHLTSTYGYNTLASFALDPQKQRFFSSTGKAFISYVLQGDVVLVIGDPIGPAQELPLVLTEFLAFWRARHKPVAFWQAREELLDLYRSHRLHVLKIGEDAIIDVQKFTLKGGKMANVRTSFKRAEKSAMHVVFYKGAGICEAHREQMARISQAWLAHKGGSEMGFSMGRFVPGNDTTQFTALAFDLQGTMHAFLTFIPIYGRNGWSLDLLRRDEQATPGTMELLIVRSLEYFKTCGNTTVSLGLAPLNNNNQCPPSLLDRFCSILLQRSGKFQHFQTLTSFKQKFQPSWENRYLIFSRQLSLPQIGLALNAVHIRQ
jgi:phosphatidylglycerol lysyltransferase